MHLPCPNPSPLLLYIFQSDLQIQTPAAIAMVFEFTYGGELYMRMKQIGKMSESESKFYICELALAIHYLQDKMKIVYRYVV